jgi:hypothetical protein
LVFPSQLTRERPDLPDPAGKAVTFEFEGPVLNVYATLAVRFSHSGVFKKGELWKNAATYTATVGGTCGVFLREVEEGHGELILFFGEAASEETRFQFEEFIRTHLERRALPDSIHRRRVFVCHECHTPVADVVVVKRRERSFNQVLVTYLSGSELRDLCFDLKIDYEALSGENKSDKARELIAHCERHGHYTELIEICYRLRPNAPW